MASNVKYNCIEKFAKNNSWKFKEYTNKCAIWKGSDVKNYFSFDQNGNFKRFKDNVVSSSGTWACDGLLTVPRNRYSNFILTTSDGVYYSSDGFKKRDNINQPNPEQTTEPEPSAGSTTQPPATPATEEPTYDKSKFPLKLDSRGPEVVQLQNYLNELIPFEPLVVDGIFGKKTQDKLIQLQNKLIQLQKYTSI